MDRFVTTLASLSLMVLAFIASVQAGSAIGPIDIGDQDGGNGGGAADFF